MIDFSSPPCVSVVNRQGESMHHAGEKNGSMEKEVTERKGGKREQGQEACKVGCGQQAWPPGKAHTKGWKKFRLREFPIRRNLQ